MSRSTDFRQVRLDPNIPLVVPEVNPDTLKRHIGLIANPNCSTIQMLVALKPIHDLYTIRRIVVSTYQAVSGSGQKAIDELHEQVKQFVANKKISSTVYPHQIAFNALPHIDIFLENGYTKEEMKMVHETHKILDASIKVSPTTVRIPVIRSHSEAINIETQEAFEVQDIVELLQHAPGVKVIDDVQSNAYPLAIEAECRDEVFVGRIRRDASIENGLNLWVVSDNLRKGAALGEIISCALLSHFLEIHGIPSEPLTGYQTRILTIDAFSHSDILNIDTTVIKKYLNQGKVVIIEGFQGMTWDGKITTLGRGGSDTTAVELGGYLQAEYVDIFTDVPGVAIVDPRLVPDAAYIENISYTEMYQLASHGAKVIHPRAVKAAEKFHIPVRIRSTFSDTPGTLISSTSCLQHKKIFGLPLDKDISYLKIGKENGPLPEFGNNSVVICKAQENSYDIYLRKESASTFLAKFRNSSYEYNEKIGRLSIFFHPENQHEIGAKMEEYLTTRALYIQDVFWFENHASLFMEHDKAPLMAQDLYHLF